MPHVGTVVISYLPLLVIHDRATNGRRFYLAGIQASECLSFLKANRQPSKRDVRAACPGAIGSAPTRKNQPPESIGALAWQRRLRRILLLRHTEATGRPSPTPAETAEDPVAAQYAIYILTPNMWEEPWVRQLLAELPMSRYEILDIWSPPPARPRARRLAIRLESLLPGPLRPTRRMLRRVVDPHDFSVFVYNSLGPGSSCS